MNEHYLNIFCLIGNGKTQSLISFIIIRAFYRLCHVFFMVIALSIRDDYGKLKDVFDFIEL